MSQTYPNEQKKKLTAQQRTAALLLADGTTIAKTATQVGVCEKTVDLWKHKPEFMEAISLAEDDLYSDSLKLLKRTAKAAIVTLINCLDPKISPYVRVSAASKLLEQAMEVHSIKVLEARIQELESMTRGEE